VLEVWQHFLKVPGVVGPTATGAALKAVGLAPDFGTSFDVEVPFEPPPPKVHKLAVG
jgi:hypothetical protein